MWTLLGAELSVVQAAEQTKSGVRYKEPKGGRPRSVALPLTVVTELAAYKRYQASRFFRARRSLSEVDRIVTLGKLKPARPDAITHEWVRFLGKNPDLPRARFHDLRHTHATHLLASGVHPKVASERLGHSQVSITLDTYSHVLPNMQADAAAVIDRAVTDASNGPGAASTRPPLSHEL